MPDPASSPAADWLLARFSTTDVFDEDADEYAGVDCIQPMFELKSDTEPGSTMHVTRADYADRGRWWL